MCVRVTQSYLIFVFIDAESVFRYKTFLGVVDTSFITLVFRFLKVCVVAHCGIACHLQNIFFQDMVASLYLFFFGGRVPYDGLRGGVRTRGCVWRVFRNVASARMGMCIARRLSNTGYKI